jgi:hypothetical protein
MERYEGDDCKKVIEPCRVKEGAALMRDGWFRKDSERVEQCFDIRETETKTYSHGTIEGIETYTFKGVKTIVCER